MHKKKAPMHPRLDRSIPLPHLPNEILYHIIYFLIHQPDGIFDARITSAQDLVRKQKTNFMPLAKCPKLLKEARRLLMEDMMFFERFAPRSWRPIDDIPAWSPWESNWELGLTVGVQPHLRRRMIVYIADRVSIRPFQAALKRFLECVQYFTPSLQELVLQVVCRRDAEELDARLEAAVTALRTLDIAKRQIITTTWEPSSVGLRYLMNGEEVDGRQWDGPKVVEELRARAPDPLTESAASGRKWRLRI